MEVDKKTWYMYENYVISVHVEYVENDVVQQCDFYQPLPADELVFVHRISNVLPQMPRAEGEEQSLLVPMQQPITVADVERMIHDMHNGADGIIQPDPFDPYDYDLYDYDMEEEEKEEEQEEDEYANDADDESDDCVSMASYTDYGYYSDDWAPFQEMFDDEEEFGGGYNDYDYDDDDFDDIDIDDVDFDDYEDDVIVDDFDLVEVDYFNGEGWDGEIVWDNPQMELSDDSGAYDDDEVSLGE